MKHTLIPNAAHTGLRFICMSILFADVQFLDEYKAL